MLDHIYIQLLVHYAVQLIPPKDFYTDYSAQNFLLETF